MLLIFNHKQKEFVLLRRSFCVLSKKNQSWFWEQVFQLKGKVITEYSLFDNRRIVFHPTQAINLGPHYIYHIFWH